MENNKPKKGQTIFCVQEETIYTKESLHETVVTKVGKKYFYLNINGDPRYFNNSDWVESGTGNHDKLKAYGTRAEAEQYLTKMRNIRYISCNVSVGLMALMDSTIIAGFQKELERAKKRI